MCVQAVAGAGFDWKFSEEAVHGGILMRVMSMVVSVGGMLITALLLGIVSGAIHYIKSEWHLSVQQTPEPKQGLEPAIPLCEM